LKQLLSWLSEEGQLVIRAAQRQIKKLPPDVQQGTLK
jgi:hypothetical protein